VYDHHVATWHRVSAGAGIRPGYVDYVRRGYQADQHEAAAYEGWLRDHTTAAELRTEPPSEVESLRQQNDAKAKALGLDL
jgi:hypothetical protein